MTKDRLANEYFDWVYNLVCGKKKESYRKLLYFLHSQPFYSNIEMDMNRAEDGIDLRYRFGKVANYPQAVIASYLDTDECSVLEMMAALSNRCEESIMTNPEFGDRTGEWFWSMLQSLGLNTMSDSRFDKDKAIYILNRFLNHEYDRDGKGGLFAMKHPTHDMREAEIWCQMWWHLAEVLETNR